MHPAHNALIELAGALNQAWNATLATVKWDSVSIEQAQQVFRDAIGDPAQAPGGELQNILGSIGDLSGGFPDVNIGRTRC